jgi:oxygen-independent coproporphyrinogen-3 oxidase
LTESLHIYVHVPFCARKCPYCHFYNLGHDDGRERVYLDALAREIAGWRRSGAFEKGRLATLYWGGGSPSLLTGDGFERLADLTLGVSPRGEPFEWTIEMNPDDVTSSRLDSYRERGVTRLSIGAQSFDDDRLAFLGREHDAEQARGAIQRVAEVGFEDVSIDLMFNLSVPGRRKAWVGDLDTAFSLPIRHLSLYGLTLEPGTAFHTRDGTGEVLTVRDRAYASEYRAACRMARRAGFEHYEVSSFARPGFRSRHNTAYWDGSAYLGLGPSAHSFDGVRRWANVASLVAWADALATDGDTREFVEMVTPSQRDLETLFLGLRMGEGVPLDHPVLVSEEAPAVVDRLVTDGLCERSEHRLECTERGFLVLDSILEGLAAAAGRAGVIDTVWAAR